MKIRTSFLIIALIIVGFPGMALGNDPGDLGTVIIEGGPLVVNQSHAITLTIVNDHPVPSASLGFVMNTIDGGFARYDSVRYVGRLADPEICGFRTVNVRDNDGVPPDSILTGILAVAITYPLPPGDGPVMELYYTGVAAGTMAIDSAFIPPAGEFILVMEGGMIYTPGFVTSPITIQEGNPVPTITLSVESPQGVVGEEIVIGVSAESTVDPDVTLELVSLTGYDDETELPTSVPIFEGDNPVTFRWTPAAADIGVWQVTFRACDTEGTCAIRTTDIQVVAHEGYLLSFSLTPTSNSCYAYGMAHGNFNETDNPELCVVGTDDGKNKSFQYYGYDPSAGFELIYEEGYGTPRFGPEVGYFDADEFLDIVLRRVYPFDHAIEVFRGTGQDTFLVSKTTITGAAPRSACLGEFTGDEYLDYASAIYDKVHIYDGGTDPPFQFAKSITVSGAALSVNSSDFDEDGYDDMAVGTPDGVSILLGDGAGNFMPAYFYDQVYGAVDIEVTNEGSDFNDDGIFDLCISTPSLGGDYSEMVVYLGNGDGSFQQSVVRTVKGQIFGNCVGDFNGDGILDIAYVNGARNYTGILFGDGDGSFTNELRYWIPFEYLKCIDRFDVDLDGDMDIVVAADLYQASVLILMTSDLDPEGFDKRSLAISGCNNADMSLVSTSGLEMNRNRSTMPSAQFFRRSMDQNTVIDQFGTLALVEDGRYTLIVQPKPNLPPGEPFTIEFTLDGNLYRLAKDVPMSAGRYQFSIYASFASDILPQPGKFVTVNPPTFFWKTSGEYDFQLATDIDFTDILYELIVSGNTCTLPASLPVSDTATFYWRVKPHARGDYDCLYVVNIVSGGSSSCGDANNDGAIGLPDAIYLINYMFKGGPPPDPVCIGDVNGSGGIGIGDAVYLINFVFRGGPMPVDNCCP